MSIETQIISEIARALEVDESSISVNTMNSDVDEWDSLGQISILVRLDLIFNNVSERVPALASVSSVKEIVELIATDLG
jgi:hypothetical protein